MKNKLLSFIILFSSLGLSQERKTYEIRNIAFYNVENLFDITNDTLIHDDDRTPDGKDQWTKERYQKKIVNLAHVISAIVSKEFNNSPDIIGLCEVENHAVLKDLISHPSLIAKGYGTIHFDSPDERGIDVALLYKKSVFIPASFKSHRLLLFNDDGFRDYTRDQLVVNGYLDREEINFIVNHWPSRSGGELRSRPHRIAAAKLNKKIIDSLRFVNPDSKIIAMGDFNDDPTNHSFKKILKTKGKTKNLEENDLYNPMEKLFKKGVGSLAYRDKWNLFDQFYLTSNLISNNKKNYSLWKAGIFNPSYLSTKKGRYKGYPFRTYAGGNYLGGYSDHYPIYMYLIRESPTLTPTKDGD